MDAVPVRSLAAALRRRGFSFRTWPCFQPIQPKDMSPRPQTGPRLHAPYQVPVDGYQMNPELVTQWENDGQFTGIPL